MTIFSVVVVIAAVVLTLAVAIVVGRRPVSDTTERDSDSRSFVGAVLSGLFIVVLAFYVVIAWTESDTAESNALAEASALADLHYQVEVAPEAQRERIRTGVEDYARLVADDEWDKLADGGRSEAATTALNSLRTEVVHLPTTPEQVQIARDRGMERVREISDLRRARLDQAQGLSPTGYLMLVATIIGAIAMIGYPILVGTTTRARHLIALGVMAGAVAFTCVLCLDIAQPFRGDLKVEPDAFVTLSEELRSVT
ncbi:DUF4239 domain-containing protein [Actinosynnema sp. NPDC047251]|uniref:bestrophin-like domain n=1 Tax=Saccharothrix espanaensis TaxID=103731 RepID=UPI00031707FE|nr:DUF4239 domain-containing protein [Saccharothrix espanaensis]